MPLLRSLLAIVLGVLAGFLVVMLVELLSMSLFPVPGGVNPSDPDGFRDLFARLPAGAVVLVLVAHALGAFAGGWTSAWRAPMRPILHGLVVAGIVMAAGIVNLRMIPHPAWFVVTDLALYLPFGFLGAKLAPRARRAA